MARVTLSLWFLSAIACGGSLSPAVDTNPLVKDAGPDCQMAGPVCPGCSFEVDGRPADPHRFKAAYGSPVRVQDASGRVWYWGEVAPSGSGACTVAQTRWVHLHFECDRLDGISGIDGCGGTGLMDIIGFHDVAGRNRNENLVRFGRSFAPCEVRSFSMKDSYTVCFGRSVQVDPDAQYADLPCPAMDECEPVTQDMYERSSGVLRQSFQCWADEYGQRN
jgi:hypothetical protein